MWKEVPHPWFQCFSFPALCYRFTGQNTLGVSKQDSWYFPIVSQERSPERRETTYTPHTAFHMWTPRSFTCFGKHNKHSLNHNQNKRICLFCNISRGIYIMILATTGGDAQAATVHLCCLFTANNPDVNTASHKLHQKEAATIINTGHIFMAWGGI